VYRNDARFPVKQGVATRLLRQGIGSGDAALPFQALVEYVAAVTRPLNKGGQSLLSRPEALREVEEFLGQFPVLYPVEAMFRLAVRGAATYQLGWFDAQLWSYAEFYGLPEIYSEDFQSDAVYGTVRIVNPFL
jgi:predicted nucleic acid-binding protein